LAGPEVPPLEIQVDGWRSGIRFDAAHIIPGHPKCGHLHGHTYALGARLEGEVAERGFITDFGVVKDALRDLADHLDHRVLVQEQGPEVEVEERGDQVEWQVGKKSYTLPAEDVRLLPVEYTSAEELAGYALDQVLDDADLPDHVEALEVGVDETYGKGARATRDLR
jgi:6-pyruvoyltetrahydropterin/6-carboxytetrahydropterin synthase